MARRKKKLTRQQTWFALFCILALFVSFGLSAIVANAGGKFSGMSFAITVIVTFAVFVIGYAILSLPVVKGRIGEARVNRILKGLSKKYGGHFIHDVIVKGEDGKTSQIDHIYVCSKGVFVIETKNYAGRIYGSQNQKQWTQVLAYGHNKNKLYNPVMQNYTHIRRLNEALPEQVDMVSVVVFVRGNIDFIDSDGVYTLRGLKQVVRDGSASYTEEKVQAIATAIQAYKDNPITTTKEHVQAIKEGICPRCGEKLILRTSKKDGRQFYGCSNYPNCKFTKPVE